MQPKLGRLYSGEFQTEDVGLYYREATQAGEVNWNRPYP